MTWNIVCSTRGTYLTPPMNICLQQGLSRIIFVEKYSKFNTNKSDVILSYQSKKFQDLTLFVLLCLMSQCQCITQHYEHFTTFLFSSARKATISDCSSAHITATIHKLSSRGLSELRHLKYRRETFQLRRDSNSGHSECRHSIKVTTIMYLLCQHLKGIVPCKTYYHFLSFCFRYLNTYHGHS